MTGNRDGYKNKVYAAEAVAFGFTADLDDAKAVQAYCDKVVRSAKFKALWAEYHLPLVSYVPSSAAPPPTKVIVKMTRGHGARVYRNRTVLYRAPGRGALRHVPFIEIGQRGMCTETVLHELAHLIAHEDHHGREFARVLLLLVRRFRPDGAATLLEQYKLRRIRYTKPTAPKAPASEKAAAR